MSENTYDTIVVGGGIAGLTAGIYLARAGQKTLIIQGDYKSNTEMPGGQLLLTPTIENFPGFTGSGTELIEAVLAQAENAGCELIEEEVIKFNFSEDENHHVFTEDEEYNAKSIILATGAIARRLGIPGEDDFFAKGVSTCATCDGDFYKGKNVAVVGGGDTAIEEALYLADIANKVTLVHRRDELRTDSIESVQLMKKPNVEVLWNTVIESVAGDKFLQTVRHRNTVTGETSVLPLDGLFVAIGHNPATESFDGSYLELSDGNYLKSKDTYTNIPGVFGAGDVADSVYRQAVTAAATGAQSAMNSIKYNKTK